MKYSFPKITRLSKPASIDLYGLANTPIGFIVAGWQQNMLVRLTILPAGSEKDMVPLLDDLSIAHDVPRNDARAKELVAQHLFPNGSNGQWSGHFTDDLDLGFYGTDFQHAVMQAMNRIPTGTTISYNTLGQKAHNGATARAVGSVCARNHLPLVVPCHRVVTSSGELGSYGYGTAMKRQLLHWENKSINPY